MTEQLHDLLTRIADEAGPGSSDPTLWSRAQRARRRDRVMRASAAALTALVVAGALAIGWGTHNASPPANRTPAPHTGPGIPSTVRGIHGDGGLELETDLAIGPASVAIATHSGAFVVTAADGVYHRLRLPGFEPSAFNDTRRGLALSPDGSRLAYAWHAPKSAGSKSEPKVGTRVLDLRTGALQKIPKAPGYFVDSKVRFSTYGYAWSPNGRYLIFDTLTQGPAGTGPDHWWVGVDTARAHFFMFTHETRDNSCPVATDCPPMTLVDPHLSARVKPLREFTGSSEKSLVVTSSAYYITGLPEAPSDWTVGRFTPDGRRLLLQPDGVGTGLVLVTDHYPRAHRWQGEGAVTPLPLDSADWPDGAKIDVLGWVGPDHALATINRATGPDTWKPDADLALLAINSAADPNVEDTTVDLQVVGHVEPGDAGSTYSFATDLATADEPTQHFDNGSPEKSDPSTAGALRSHDSGDGGTTPLVAFTAAGLVLLATVALMVARSRRSARGQDSAAIHSDEVT